MINAMHLGFKKFLFENPDGTSRFFLTQSTVEVVDTFIVTQGLYTLYIGAQ